jgi:16S rRNA (cytosine1402-N4)-methyltransferase
MSNLEKVLESIFDLTSDKGRIVVVSYHSLEDRIVKNFFKSHIRLKQKNKYPKEKIEIKKEKYLNILTKKPILPEFQEIKENRKARSAKLRAAEVCI